MRCLKCGEIFVHKLGNLEMTDNILGNYIVPDTEYELCEKCGEILYSPITLRAIEKVEKKRRRELLLEKPLKDFISGPEVGRILGISRQAVHKHRIERGFIHFVRYLGKILYHRESVELYKKTGDGRFPLAKMKKRNIFNPQKIISLAIEKRNRKAKFNSPTTANTEESYTNYERTASSAAEIL
jgi:hypothetical protein